MFEQIAPVEYDSSGRMKYNSDLHDRQGKAWSDEDKEYLINWYTIIGLEEMSLALGRTEATIANKANKYRNQGRMSKESPNRVVRELKTKAKSRCYNPNGRPRKLNVAIDTLLTLKQSKSYGEIAEMFNVSKNLIEKRFSAYKKATKNPDQSVQSSMSKNSHPLYHTEGGMQVAN